MKTFTSDFLNTRLSIYASRLLGRKLLSSLIDLELDDILQKLHQLTGHDYSAKVRIEQLLATQTLDDFQLLVRPFSGIERRFFYFAIRWFELVNLKVLIRGKFSGVSNSEVQEQLVDLGDFNDLPLDQLLETEDPYEMLRLLETTAYGAIVRQARHVYEEQGNDLFLLDATIDRSFFIDLKQRMRFLHPEDSQQLQHVMGALLDRFNLLWLLRYRFSYEISPAKSFYLLTASGKRLHADLLLKLASLDDLQQVIDALPDTIRHQLTGKQTISDIEVVMEFYTMGIADNVLSHQHNLVARTFSYLLLREAESRFLQALIKGKQLSFNKALIEQAVGSRH